MRPSQTTIKCKYHKKHFRLDAIWEEVEKKQLKSVELQQQRQQQRQQRQWQQHRRATLAATTAAATEAKAGAETFHCDVMRPHYEADSV